MFSTIRNAALAAIAATPCLAVSTNAAPLTYDITFRHPVHEESGNRAEFPTNPGGIEPAIIAHPPNEDGTQGLLTPTGSFTYDAATQTFSNFIVHVGSLAVLDFTSTANSGLNGGDDCPGTPSNSAGSFAVMSGTTTCATNQLWFFATNHDAFFASQTVGNSDPAADRIDAEFQMGSPTTTPFEEDGTFTIAAVTSVPEPMTAALLILPLSGLFVARRRAASAALLRGWLQWRSA